MATGDETDAHRFRLFIVTGVSGSGRGSAMRVLEDLGFYCVDNLPVALARSVVGLAREHDPKIAGVALGIDARERAALIIDTSTTTIHELRELITAAVIGAKTGDRMTIALVSFGYKYGHPLGLDLILDVRFIPNPFFMPGLRELSGTDPRVREYVMAHPEARRFIHEVTRLLTFLVPLYRREGKSYLTIGLGCTGGRHRSPVLARELRDALIHEEIEVEVRDHDLARDDR